MSADLPKVLPPEQLEPLLGRRDLLIVDLSKPESYLARHIPGAVFIDYARLVRRAPPAMGLLPEPEQLAEVLGHAGFRPDHHVIACDDEGGGKAARLCWTLECYGHHQWSLLDGGMIAWLQEGLPLETDPATPLPTRPRLAPRADAVVDRAYLLDHLADPALRLVDARSPEEYSGIKRHAERGGRIPGAIHLEWTRLMDQTRHYRLLPPTELRALFESRGIRPEHHVVAYCQTHHRSALTWLALRHLGYPWVRGYPGSWSDWGNRTDTPVEA